LRDRSSQIEKKCCPNILEARILETCEGNKFLFEGMDSNIVVSQKPKV
jgi:hypothetical protein